MNSLEFDCLSPSQRVAHFDRTHGRCVLLDHWYLYEDGAARETNPLGALIEPPEDPILRQKHIVQFERVLFENLLKLYQDFRQEFLNHLSEMKRQPGLMEPNEIDVNRLKSLGKKALAQKVEYDKALAKLQKLQPPAVVTSVADYNAARMARIDGLLKVAGINN